MFFYEQTANGMAFVLTDLALNQDKQEILNKEIQEVLGDQQTVTKEHLSKMSYLKACVKESQRYGTLTRLLECSKYNSQIAAYSFI